jgi:uncharacterized protein with HEPN domain
MTAPVPAAAVTPIPDAARLGLIEEAATAVAILVEGVEREQLLHSRLTRGEVLRQLRPLADSAARIDTGTCQAMPELDWGGWNNLRPRLAAAVGATLDDALWFACESMVPAVLLWLRVYQHRRPTPLRMAQ